MLYFNSKSILQIASKAILGLTVALITIPSFDGRISDSVYGLLTILLVPLALVMCGLALLIVILHVIILFQSEKKRVSRLEMFMIAFAYVVSIVVCGILSAFVLFYINELGQDV